MIEPTMPDLTETGRFAFGENWRRFLSILSEKHIQQAEDSLRLLLDVPDLHGNRFLDAGCGSGLFSLAARRLGAMVTSFDFDPECVDCTQELRHRYFAEDPDWHIELGSVLDRAYLAKLGNFDVVYSWGVLHHTGAMWPALDNIASSVSGNGKLCIAIYNDQGKISDRWRTVKRAYNRLPRGLRFVVTIPVLIHLNWRASIKDLFRGRPFDSWRNKGRERGMSAWRDLIDWVGGYPFEVAKPDAILDFYLRRGFALTRLTTCGGSLGCNEYVFHRNSGLPWSELDSRVNLKS